MDPISSASAFTILLRQRLMERAKLAAKGAAQSLAAITNERTMPTSALSTLVANKGLDDHETHRALVENLLGSEFGDHMLNEARFQQLVEQVTRALESDPDLARQMKVVLRSLS